MLQKKQALISLILFVFVTGLLSAEAGVSFVSNSNVYAGSVKAEGSVSGCTNGACDRVVMNVTGTALTGFCRNEGGLIVPGAKRVTVDTNTTAQFIFEGTSDSETREFFISTEILPTREAAGCPSSNWTVVDLTGPITVALSVYEKGNPLPSDNQVFACQAVLGSATDCIRVE